MNYLTWGYTTESARILSLFLYYADLYIISAVHKHWFLFIISVFWILEMRNSSTERLHSQACNHLGCQIQDKNHYDSKKGVSMTPRLKYWSLQQLLHVNQKQTPNHQATLITVDTKKVSKKLILMKYLKKVYFTCMVYDPSLP